ncbi:MAG: alpha/beta fold hydrolase [Alphaproteobacteria bacterium]|jgi:predicted alpha/beta-fold hydrolase|nr:alpha/beta fold hydrolase [Alphaproteobacteria bacterium]
MVDAAGAAGAAARGGERRGPVPAGSFPPFRERPPWIGGDLQTCRNMVLDRVGAGPRGPVSRGIERLHFPMADGTGDVLVGRLDRPAAPQDRPLVLLVHGITGCEDSAYMRASAACLVDRGHPVLRLNLRGSGPSRGKCRHIYHAGRSEDLRRVAERLAPDWAAHGMLAIGFSLGGNMLLKYLGEDGAAVPFRAAASVSAPIDLAATARRMLEPRNRLYHRQLLAWLRAESLAAAALLTEGEREAVRQARSVYQFDDAFVAPRNGFGSADTYYEVNSARHFLSGIRIPTLVIHAGDDPWIPAAAYRTVDWAPLRRVLTPLLPEGGGHVGFHDVDGPPPWHDRCCRRFFQAILAASPAAGPAST